MKAGRAAPLCLIGRGACFTSHLGRVGSHWKAQHGDRALPLLRAAGRAGSREAGRSIGKWGGDCGLIQGWGAVGPGDGSQVTESRRVTQRETLST